MSLKIFKKTKKRPGVVQALIILLASLLYASLIATGYAVLAGRIHTETGQLVPGERVVGEQFSRSLDLRAAVHNSYPSNSLTIVKDLGTADGVDEKIISFKVPIAGLTEYGLMVLPHKEMPKDGFPAIIYCHGYDTPALYSTTEEGLSDMVFYAQHGFAVIKPDFRGQGLSLDQGQPDSAYYSMAYNTDVMSLISALKKTSFINKSQLNLWGHSMGAYIALRAAVLSPDIQNLIILSGPVDSLSKMYLSYIPPSDVNNLNALKTRNNVIAKYGTPVEDTNFWKFASPINMLPRIKAHIQINVGELDQTVPPEFSADLSAALNQHHIKHDYFVYPDGPHSLEPQRPTIWSRSLQALRATGSPALPSD